MMMYLRVHWRVWATMVIFLGLLGGLAGPISAQPPLTDLIERAARVRPHPRQVAWQQREFIAFIHFTVNTFTDREWGTGKEDPAIFNPTELDARQWARVCRDAGMKLIILTAKHHDGFCLWPSRFTEHSVKNSGWRDGQGDVVGELAKACREFGLALGLYLSPWDMHEATYGDQEKYNAFYKNQLVELLTNYGELAEVWFDGAKGPNARDMEYDWTGYYALVRELQPNAVIFNGPDIRWVGNEAGYARPSEWSVLGRSRDWSFGQPNAQDGDLGSLEKLAGADRLVWYPAETDVSIRPGWFYHAGQDDKVKSLAALLDIYYSSVGRNSVLLLNLPPDRRGLIHENDVRRLREFRAVLDATFATNLALGAQAAASCVLDQDTAHAAGAITDGDPDTYWASGDWVTAAEIEIDLGRQRTFNRACLQEYIPAGQRIEEFALDAWLDGQWKPIARGTAIGYKRLERFDDVTARRVRIRILRSRLSATLANFGLYYQGPTEDILNKLN